MNQKLIQASHIYILLILFSGFMVHVLSLPILLSTAKRDAWLSALASGVPITLWLLFIFYIYKKTNPYDLLSFLNHAYSKWVSIIFSIMFCAHFFVIALITLKFTIYWANANYTFDVPNYVVVSLFALICYYSSAKGLSTICTMAMLILPFVVLFGLLVGVGNIPNKDYEQLFPIFENGYFDFFKGLGYACSGLVEVSFILFLTSNLKGKLKMKWLILTGIILAGLSFGPLAGAIAEFGSVEAEKMRNPAYEEWRLLTIGMHVTRLDFLSIFQWLSGAFVRISLSLFIAAKGFSLNTEHKWVLPMLYVLLIIAASIHWDSVSFIYFLKNFYFPINLIFQICLLLLVFLLIKLKGVSHEK
ncbi:spore gernimation protein [Bacillus sp. AFS076308]|uniref:GerAB/ArcD/ProY family transporter n=1 Tax=unclassified Bacillus (in: firmicutes) TaxID=185979 RepID=UPI000BF9B062|nr:MULTISPECIES: endospore germination permease [unclassified Bacillus (in: firmicutes)]PFO08351.1 spore gernimation protein [Bacillus sp. AFS076308]PGV50640.1 spore gernimation protein [Bacillus sp. AFS037270]